MATEIEKITLRFKKNLEGLERDFQKLLMIVEDYGNTIDALARKVEAYEGESDDMRPA